MATIAAQQLTLFPGAPAPPVAQRPAAVRPCIGIERYTDLTPAQAHSLASPAQAPTVTRNAFQRAGWIDEEGALTETGEDVQRRARAILAGARLPAPVLHVSRSDIRFRIRRTDQWRAVHLKCLLYLTHSPETAWRYLTGIFGVPVVETLQDAGLVTGDRRRGALQRITENGLAALRQALDRIGVPYS